MDGGPYVSDFFVMFTVLAAAWFLPDILRVSREAFVRRWLGR